MQAKLLRKNKKPILSISAAVLVLAIAGYFGYAYTTKSAWPFVASTQAEGSNDQNVNYNPPTEQEVDASQDAKHQTEDTSPVTNVSVDVSYAGKSDDGQSVEVDAYITSVIEGSGTCTATFTKGAASVSASTKGFIDATSTICEPISIPLSRFESGSWKLVVTYKSDGRVGTSSPIEVSL